MSAPRSGSWNPLRCTGTPLPPELLLAAKLILGAMLLQGYVWGLPRPWLPMWSVFDHLPGRAVRTTLIAVFCAAGLAVYLNRWVRAASFLAGLVFFFQPIVSRVHFYYSDFFCALMLMLIGLYREPWGRTLVRVQFAVMYTGSGLNKLLDPDWRSGVFMENWLGPISKDFTALAAHLPPHWAARAFSWSTIAIELSLPWLLFSPRLRRSAVCLAVLFHSASVFFVGITFGVFVSALVSGYVVFASWCEPGSVEIRFRPGSVLAAWWKRLSDLVDRDRIFTWKEDDAPRLALEAKGFVFQGLAAVRRWLVLTPLAYFVFLFLIAGQKWTVKVAPALMDAHWKLGKLALVLAAVLIAPLPQWRPVRRGRAGPAPGALAAGRPDGEILARRAP